MDTKTQEASKPAPAGEQQQAEVRIGFIKDKPATLQIQIDLDRINPAWARGVLLNVDDVIKNWYFERQQMINKIQKPGANGIKGIFKNLGFGG